MASGIILEEGVYINTSATVREVTAPIPDEESVCGRAAIASQQSTPVVAEATNG